MTQRPPPLLVQFLYRVKVYSNECPPVSQNGIGCKPVQLVGVQTKQTVAMITCLLREIFKMIVVHSRQFILLNDK